MPLAPVEPSRTVPEGPFTATGTLIRRTFSRMMLLETLGTSTVLLPNVTPTGVLLMSVSRMVTDPTASRLVLGSTAVRSKPTWHLSMLMPWYVHPHDHCCLMAVCALRI